MVVLEIMQTWFQARLAAYRQQRGLPDEALEIIEKVVITALVVVAAIAIVGILVTKATNKANSIQLDG